MRKQDPLYSLHLVECVEKYPCLYDYNLGEYNIRDVTNAAWQRVAVQMKDTAVNCRKYWRHLRIVFARNLKKDAFGIGVKSILQEKMMFLKPFMKITDNEICTNKASTQRLVTPISVKVEPGDLSSPSTTNDGVSTDDSTLLDQSNHSNDIVDKQIIQRLNVDFNNEISTQTDQHWTVTNEFNNYCKQNLFPEKRKRKLDHNSLLKSNNLVSLDEQYENYRRHYLISLLPDVEELSNHQFRLFRKKVDDFIAEIL